MNKKNSSFPSVCLSKLIQYPFKNNNLFIKYKIKRLGRVEPLGLRESFFSFFSF